MILKLVSKGKQSLPGLHRRLPARKGRRGDANGHELKRAILCAEDFCNRLRVLKTTVKLVRAVGGCLGIDRRRRTRKPAKSLGELDRSIDPGVSEWGNPMEQPSII